jgi:hypothetical protein
LTGTPIQNKLDDYGALLSFIGFPPFSDRGWFDRLITNPILAANPRGLERLRRLVAATCLRRCKGAVQDQLRLPQRIEREQRIDLNDHEREVYDFFANQDPAFAASSGTASRNTLPLINVLRLICNHGGDLLSGPALKAWHSRNASALRFLLAPNTETLCAACKSDVSGANPWIDSTELSCGHILCSKCANGDATRVSMEDMCPICEPPFTPLGSQESPDLTTIERSVLVPSTKVAAVIANIYQEQQPNLLDLSQGPVKRLVTFPGMLAGDPELTAF